MRTEQQPNGLYRATIGQPDESDYFVGYGKTAAEASVDARAKVASERIERLKALLDEAEGLADELTNAESDFRTSSRLSRIVGGIDVAREHLEGAYAPRNH